MHYPTLPHLKRSVGIEFVFRSQVVTTRQVDGAVEVTTEERVTTNVVELGEETKLVAVELANAVQKSANRSPAGAARAPTEKSSKQSGHPARRTGTFDARKHAGIEK